MKLISNRNRISAATLLAGVCLWAQVAPTQAGVGDYFADRWYDFADIFTARVSGAKDGKSLGVMVRATTLAQVGLVYFNGEHVGIDRRAAGIWRERRLHGALGPFARTEIEMRTISGTAYAFDDSPWAKAEERGIVRNGGYYDDGRGEPLAVGVELQPGILPGFEFRLHPLQAVDFLIGWTTMDIYDDDAPGAAIEDFAPAETEAEVLPEQTEIEITIDEKPSDEEPGVELTPEETELPAAPNPNSKVPEGDVPLNP